MSEEEKKAIEYLKRHILPYYGSKGKIEFMLNDIILNLIETQQKEIEELKKKKKKNVVHLKDVKKELIEMRAELDIKNAEIQCLSVIHDSYKEMFEENNYISKDKIKAKIEEFKIVRNTILENEAEYKRPMMTYDLIRNDYCEKMLQELLEEE